MTRRFLSPLLLLMPRAFLACLFVGRVPRLPCRRMWRAAGLLGLVGLLLTGAAVPVTAQALPAQLRFGRATERDGLPANAVQCLLRDHAGFLWVGTTDGLTRYDGTTFHTYRARRGDPTALPPGQILTLAEDARHRIWVGTHAGVAYLNAARDAFRTWRHRAGDTASLPTDYDCRLLIGRAGTVWLGSGAGLSRYDPPRNAWVRVPLPGAGGLISALLEDHAGRLWLGSAGRVRVFDPRAGRRGQVVASVVVPPANGALPPITGLLEDHAGQVWATAWGAGLVRLDMAAGRAESRRWEAPGGLAGVDNIALAAAETTAPDGRHTLWLGTAAGLLRLDQPAPGAGYPADLARATRLYPARLDPDAAQPPAGNVTTLLADPTGRLWLGTESGLSWLDPQQQFFADAPLAGGRLPALAPQHVLADRDPATGARQYWVASWYGDGLALYDSAFQWRRAWPRLPLGAADADAGQVCDVLRSRRDGALWVATFNGLVRFDPATGASRLFQPDPADPTSLPDARCVALLEDTYGRLWVGTYGNGLACLETPADRRAGHFRHYGPATASSATDSGAPGLPDRHVTALAQDRAGRVWVGLDGGLARLDPAAPGGVRAYRADPASAHALPHATVNALWPAPDGRLWVATREGIGIWRPETDTFDHLTSQQGLPVDEVYGLHPDATGHLWLSSRRGLVRATLRAGLPVGPFRVFDTANGLPKSNLDGLFDALPDGRLALGFAGRLVLVDPAALRPNRRPPTVVLTEIRLFDDVLRLGQPLDSVPCLDLTPTQNTLSFAFAVLSFANAAHNHAYYRLDLTGTVPTGPAARWTPAGTRRYATFANLPGGDYTLRLRATNDEGLPGVREATFRFRIRRPFTQTGWFWGAVAGAAVLLGRARIRRIRAEAARQNQLTREMAGLELRAIRAQMNPHFLFNALNAVQECILTGRPETAGRYLVRFARLLRLVLENSEQGSVPLDAELESLRIYAELEGLRLDGVTVRFEIDPDLADAQPRIPAMVLQPYLENAFWHGLAGRPATGRGITITLAFTPDERAVHATIEDTGIGRRAAGLWGRHRAGQHHSMGMRLTERRLHLLMRQEADGTAEAATPPLPPVRIIDLTDPATGVALGTRVDIWLPVR